MKKLIVLLCLMANILTAQTIIPDSISYEKSSLPNVPLGTWSFTKSELSNSSIIGSKLNIGGSARLFSGLKTTPYLVFYDKIKFNFENGSIKISYDKNTVDADGIQFLNYISTMLRADTIQKLNNEIRQLKNNLSAKGNYAYITDNQTFLDASEPSTLYTYPFKAPYRDNQLQIYTKTPDKLSIHPDIQLPALLDNAGQFKDIPLTSFLITAESDRFIAYKSITLKLNESKEVVLRYTHDIRVFIEAGKSYRVSSKQEKGSEKYTSLFYVIEEL